MDVRATGTDVFLRPKQPYTMDKQYNEMKHALMFLGLNFHDMAAATVQYRNGEVIYSYNGRSIAFKE
jgi:hypothetical protein